MPRVCACFDEPTRCMKSYFSVLSPQDQRNLFYTVHEAKGKPEPSLIPWYFRWCPFVKHLLIFCPLWNKFLEILYNLQLIAVLFSKLSPGVEFQIGLLKSVGSKPRILDQTLSPVLIWVWDHQTMHMEENMVLSCIHIGACVVLSCGWAHNGHARGSPCIFHIAIVQTSEYRLSNVK